MTESGELTATPVVDKLTELIQKNILSFHALPISGKRSISKSSFYDKYRVLFGDDFYRSDLTLTGETFDTPVLPTRCMYQSELLTSKAFGSKHSFYITMGTTTSNRIVINSLVEDNERALVDKSCHISIHFGLRERKCDITYMEPERSCMYSGRSHFSMQKLIDRYRQANVEGKPYKLVVINGSSYEGVIYNLKSVIKECILINDNVSFLIDEAWFAFGYFHERYKKLTAMWIAEKLQREMPDKNICIVSTQSAHKSLSALRQGSYIHAFGDSKTIKKIRDAKFSIHTTSPSYPIIASLELARAQAVAEGKMLIDEVLEIANYFRNQIYENPRLLGYAINGEEFINKEYKDVVLIDPLKISINLSGLNIDPKEFIRFAFQEFGIYINRYCNTSILINIHVGIKKEDIVVLLNAMADFQQAVLKNKIIKQSCVSKKNGKAFTFKAKAGEISEEFVIPYPPGVPILFKGDQIEREVIEKINAIVNNGVDVIVIK